MNIPKERKILITIGIAAIAALAVYIFFYRPFITRFSKVASRCRQAEADLLKTRQGLASVAVSDIKKTLPMENDISSCIDEITSLGRQKNITFISITPKQTELAAGGKYKMLALQLEIKGAYSQIGAFLGALDELQKTVVVVKNFRLTAEKTEPSKLRLGISLCIHLQA